MGENGRIVKNVIFFRNDFYDSSFSQGIHLPLCVADKSLPWWLMKEKRRFVAGAVNHCYQKTVNGELIFYSVSDYLVCFTHISVASRRHAVSVLSQVLMPDHLHGSVVADKKSELEAFVQDYTSHFARAHNALCHRNEPLLRPFGSAPKSGSKDVRSNLIYLGNNGPERKLSTVAEGYRWSFLPYFQSKHPFSEKLRLEHATHPMRQAIREVQAFRKAELPMSYAAIRRLTAKLTDVEKNQLADYIISAYQYIEYDAAIAYFGDYQTMLEAMHASKGTEYEIKEEFVGWDDKVYGQMSKLIQTHVCRTDVHDFLAWSEDKRRELFAFLKDNTDATARQVYKFLRCPPGT